MNIIKLIQEKYGENCQLRSPMTAKQAEKARKFLPKELFDILKQSNGIYETMQEPNTKKTTIIHDIIYSLQEIKHQTSAYHCEINGDGFVFTGNGTGNFYVLKPDGKIFLYEYFEQNEVYVAESLWHFFSNYPKFRMTAYFAKDTGL